MYQLSSLGANGFKTKSEPINQNKLEQFTFEITKNSLNYLGTWHFNKGLVSFTDDKIQFDKLLESHYKKLDFLKAITTIPK